MAEDFRNLLPRTYYAFFGQFARLRPVQLRVMPLILAGENVLVISPTGSGKTEAVVAPVAERALDASGEAYCLYICPTRALVNDIEHRLETPLHKLHLRVGVRHGDRKTLRGKTVPNFLITTPESLDVMLGSQDANVKDRLRTIRTVIVDEVHQFYQTHRGYQLTLLLERLKRLTHARLQRLLLSATVAQPNQIAQWFQGSDKSLQIIEVPGARPVSLYLDCLTAQDGDGFREGHGVSDLIRPIVADHQKVLMFANSRNECDWLYWKLHDQVGVDTFLHYSTLDRAFRESTERKFQSASRALCISTSTLELGIDIGDIDAVVMYGAPASVSSFAQRIGRGNRRSVTSVVYGFCREYHIDGTTLGADYDLVMFYSLLASMLDGELEARPDTELYSVFVQQYFSLAYQYGSVIVDILRRITDAVHHNTAFSPGILEQILDRLAYEGFFNVRPQVGAYYPTEKWERVKRSLQLWGNIASKAYDTVVDIDKEISVSQVPRGKAQPGRVFLFAGEPRLVTEVTGSVIKTLKLTTDSPKTIIYETMGAAIPLEVANKVQEVVSGLDLSQLPVEIDLSLSTKMRSLRQRFQDFDFARQIPHEWIDNQHCYYTFGGTWGNEILAMILRRQGCTVRTDSWRIYSSRPLSDFSFLPISLEALRSIVYENLPGIISLMSFSYHFYQLPEDLQEREVYSILDLPRIQYFLNGLRFKDIRTV